MDRRRAARVLRRRRHLTRRLPATVPKLLPAGQNMLDAPQVTLVRYSQGVSRGAAVLLFTLPDSAQVSFVTLPPTAQIGGEPLERLDVPGLVRSLDRLGGIAVSHVALIDPAAVGPLIGRMGGVNVTNPQAFTAQLDGRSRRLPAGRLALDGRPGGRVRARRHHPRAARAGQRVAAGGHRSPAAAADLGAEHARAGRRAGQRGLDRPQRRRRAGTGRAAAARRHRPAVPGAAPAADHRAAHAGDAGAGRRRAPPRGRRRLPRTLGTGDHGDAAGGGGAAGPALRLAGVRGRRNRCTAAGDRPVAAAGVALAAGTAAGQHLAATAWAGRPRRRRLVGAATRQRRRSRRRTGFDAGAGARAAPAPARARDG